MMIRIANLTKRYNGKIILDNLSLTVNNNEIVIITGRSGTGKTTLLLNILGFIKPETGTILLNEKDITSFPLEERQLAYVPQDYGLFPHLSVKDNIAFGLAVRNVDKELQEQKVREVLDAVELPYEFAARHVQDLSGGEKQRVALARALVIEPKLFLLDEPLSAVDVETKKSVGKQLRSIIKKLSIPALIVSHDPLDASILGDTIYRLENGQLKKVPKKGLMRSS